MRNELLNFLRQNMNQEHDNDSIFYGRFFIDDEDFDKFAEKAKCFTADGAINLNKFNKRYECHAIFKYNGANPNRQHGDQEIIFNQSSEYKKFTSTTEFAEFSLSELIKIYDRWNEDWSQLETSDLPKTKYDMIQIILNDLEQNYLEHNNVCDFLIKYKD